MAGLATEAAPAGYGHQARITEREEGVAGALGECVAEVVGGIRRPEDRRGVDNVDDAPVSRYVSIVGVGFGLGRARARATAARDDDPVRAGTLVRVARDGGSAARLDHHQVHHEESQDRVHVGHVEDPLGA